MEGEGGVGVPCRSPIRWRSSSPYMHYKPIVGMIAGITSSGQTQLDLYGAGLSFVKDIGGMSHASHVQ